MIKEELQNTILMYKNDRATKYVMEREFAEFMGDKSHFIISESGLKNRSYVLMLFPIKLSDGFHITYIIDENIIKNIYSEEKIVTILSDIKDIKQNILRKYVEFEQETSETELSLSMALGFIFDLYLSYYGKLSFKEVNEMNVSILPDEEELQKIKDRFNLEEATVDDREKIVLDGYFPVEGIDFCKENYIHKISGDIIINDKIDPVDRDFWFNQADALCTNTVPSRGHTEIPYDYKPDTNL